MLYANIDCRIPQGCMLGLVLLNTASGMHQVRRSCSMAVIGLPFGDLAGWRNARCLLSIIRPPPRMSSKISYVIFNLPVLTLSPTQTCTKVTSVILKLSVRMLYL